MKEIKATAITEYFRKSEFAVPSHFNQSMMFRCAKRLNSYAFKYSMRLLCGYHEALRAIWDGKQLVVREQNCLNLVHIEEHDLRRSTDFKAAMLPIVQKLQSTVNLSEGPLVHTAMFHLPEYDAVLMVIHHLAVDGVSWRIIAEDLNSIYPQLTAGAGKVKLPRIRCTFAEYAEAVHRYAVSDELAKETAYWTAVSDGIRESTKDTPKASGKSDAVKFSVGEEVTQTVIKDCTGKYGVEINDLLLTALSRAWKKVTGNNWLALSMEGHGREPFGDNPPELERIAGWFTTIYPVLVDCTGEDIAEHVKKTASTLHAIPNKGFGYGTLRHISGREELDCNPVMTFNYLGSFEEGGGSDQFFTIDNELPKGEEVSPLNFGRGVPLSINCLAVKACLTGSLGFDTGIISKESAEALMKEFASQLALL